MNRKMVFYTIGQIVLLEAALMLLPLLVASVYRDSTIPSFIFSILAAAAIGGGLMIIFHPKDRTIYAREGFVIVALAWVLLSAIGALPFFFSREIPNYVDAFFETVSGFTTTGASVLNNVEAMSHGMLFWRSFTHWIGGMGVLVLMMAIVPSASGRSIHIMRAEMPGPIVDKLVPRIRDTAKILYCIYIAITGLQIILLKLGGMSWFESVVHTFGTAGTGGFGIKVDSIGGYSPYLQWVITIFMFIFGINFNLYYFLLLKKFRSVLHSGELWTFTAIVILAVGVITWNILPIYPVFSEALRQAAFQVCSIISTTGYATADFNLWPGFSRGILLLLMFIGGCAGSTAGGLKVSRIMLLMKIVKRDLQHMLHPRSVGVIKFDGKKVETARTSAMNTYFSLYIAILLLVSLLLCLEPFDFETNLTAAISCLNNVGPGLGMVGPASSYAEYSLWAKLLLSVTMLVGRLEIYPILFTLSFSTWSRK